MDYLSISVAIMLTALVICGIILLIVITMENL
jgi:hypothetical protein